MLSFITLLISNYPLINNFPQGIILDDLISKMKLTPNKRWLLSFIQELHNKHCLLAIIQHSPLMIKLRTADLAKKLLKLCSSSIAKHRSYKVYETIEQAKNYGIWKRDILQSTDIAKLQCEKILKELQNLKLIQSFTDPKCRRIMYYAIGYKPSEYKKGTGFHNENDVIDDQYLETMIRIINEIISNAGNIGINIIDIQTFIADKKVINTKDGVLPIKDIEIILNLLMFHSNVEVIPSSISREMVERFIGHKHIGQQSIYHLIKEVQNERIAHQGIVEEENRKLSNLKRIQMQNKRPLSLISASEMIENIKENEEKFYEKVMKNDHKRRKINDSLKTNLKIEYDLAVDDSKMVENKTKLKQEFDDTNIEGYYDMRFHSITYECESALNQIPCHTCPVADECSDDGVVSSNKCPFLNEWLGLSGIDF